MKKGKMMMFVAAAFLSTGLLAACSSGSGNASNTFRYIYQAEPETLDYLRDNAESSAVITSNVIDGLLENDKYGNFVPSLAEDWSVSQDGLTYTYKLRKGVKWYTSEGEEYAEVKAQDFVTGLQHAMYKEDESKASYLIRKSIKGLDDYMNGKSDDFSTVGVKALDDYTVQYTLNAPEPYWNSKTTAGILYPVNEEFLKSKGDDFGKVGDVSSLLYNGPFLLKSMTSKSSIELAKNPEYWDKDNVKFDEVKLSYFDGQQLDKLASDFDNNTIDDAILFPNSPSFSDTLAKHESNIIYSQQDSSVRVYSFNLDRQSYNYTNKTTDQEKQSTKQAILNKNFRQAIAFGFDREKAEAQLVGKDGAQKRLRSTFTPPKFVNVGDKTFGDTVEEKLHALGDEWQGVELDDAQDGFYNPEKAKSEFEKAKNELQGQGVQFPIHLDIVTIQTDESRVNMTKSFKESVENSLGKENVQIDIHMLSEDEAQAVTINSKSASQTDWDIQNITGWGPDFQDPSTFLNIFNPSTGDSTRTYLGFDSGKNNAAANQVGMNEYENLITDADNETTDLNVRYEKFATAQAWLTDSAIVIPVSSRGASPFLRHTVPFSGPYAQSGSKNLSYKYLDLQKEPVTTEEYEKAVKKWEEERIKSNEKAQDDFAKHVK